MSSLLSSFLMLQRNAPFTDFPEAWKELSDFEVASDADLYGDAEPEMHVNSPGVFLVPAQRKNKRLRSYLMSLAPTDELFDDQTIDVFPFHFDDSRRAAKDAA
jgi:hypothetical protein